MSQKPPYIHLGTDRATCELIIHAGRRAIPYVARACKDESDSHVQDSLIRILGKIGEPALQALNDILFKLTEVWLINHTVEGLFIIGEPAAYLIALALEHPEAASVERILKGISINEHGESIAPINLVHAIATAVIEELVVRRPNRPDHFNDQVVAACLQATVDRSPQLRRQIQARLCDLTFQDNLEIRERALQVAKNLDLDDFLQLVRVRASENQEVATEISPFGHFCSPAIN